MSEHQYFEFQAIDRPLTKAEMAELRALSTRATISATRFQNEYHWGNFRGNPLTMMERYFDAHVYTANWGTHQLMLRLPRQLLDSETALQYCFSDGAELHTKGDFIILDFRSENEEGSWEEEDDEWLASLIPLRAELANGDLRPLYLSWLGCAAADFLDDDDAEPPVPAGLAALSAAQRAFADFLRVGDDLLAVAAERSAPLRERRAASSDLARWVTTLPAAEKDGLLVRLLEGEAPHLRAELLGRYQATRRAAEPTPGATATGRTVGDLLAAAAERAAAARRKEAERAAQERERHAREAAAARVTYLDGLAPRQETVWRQIDDLAGLKRAKEYDQVTQWLIDLRDLSLREGTTEEFRARVRALRLRFAKQPALLDRFDRAALPR